MGSVRASVGRSMTNLTDELGQVWTSMITAVVYAGCAAYCVTAIALLFTNNTAPWTKALGFSSVLVAGTSHYTIYFIGMGFMPQYVQYPVRPKWLYLAMDVLQGVAIGMVSASYSLAPSIRSWILAANGVCLFVQIVSLFKLYQITRGVRAGNRHITYGYDLTDQDLNNSL